MVVGEDGDRGQQLGKKAPQASIFFTNSHGTAHAISIYDVLQSAHKLVVINYACVSIHCPLFAGQLLSSWT